VPVFSDAHPTCASNEDGEGPVPLERGYPLGMADRYINTDWAGINQGTFASLLAVSEASTRSLWESVGVLASKNLTSVAEANLVSMVGTAGLAGGVATAVERFENTILDATFEAPVSDIIAEARITALEDAAGTVNALATRVKMDAELLAVAPNAFEPSMRALADQEAKFAGVRDELNGLSDRMAVIEDQIANAGLTQIGISDAVRTSGLMAKSIQSEGTMLRVGETFTHLATAGIADTLRNGLYADALTENTRLIRSLEESARVSFAFTPADLTLEKICPALSEAITSAAKNNFGEVLERIAIDSIFPTLDKLTFPEPLVVIREAESHRLLIVERFQNQWRGGQHWFILSLLSEDDHYLLAGLEPEEMEEALERALEQVILDGEYTQLLTSALDSAPFIDTLQRKDLRRGLALAQQGEFDDALHQFLAGMEGAFWSAGEGLEVVDETQRQLQKPRQPKAESIEPVFKQLPGREGFSTFLLYKVYGGHGNHARHGRSSFPRRQHVLCLVVALAGWMDILMEVPALEVLSQMLRDALAEHD